MFKEEIEKIISKLGERVEGRVAEEKKRRKHLETLFEYKSLKIRTGGSIPEKIYAVFNLIIGLPGIIVHEVGHALGLKWKKSVKTVFWMGPGLSLAIGTSAFAGSITVSMGRAIEAIMVWVGITCIITGTLDGLHDWMYWRGYPEKRIKEVEDRIS